VRCAAAEADVGFSIFCVFCNSCSPISFRLSHPGLRCAALWSSCSFLCLQRFHFSFLSHPCVSGCGGRLELSAHSADIWANVFPMLPLRSNPTLGASSGSYGQPQRRDCCRPRCCFRELQLLQLRSCGPFAFSHFFASAPCSSLALPVWCCLGFHRVVPRSIGAPYFSMRLWVRSAIRESNECAPSNS